MRLYDEITMNNNSSAHISNRNLSVILIVIEGKSTMICAGRMQMFDKQLASSVTINGSGDKYCNLYKTVILIIKC